MIATILLSVSDSAEMSLTNGYTVGAILALFLLGYLIFSLVKPEKF